MTNQMSKRNDGVAMQTKNGNGAKHHELAPPVDVFENQEEYLIVTDVPGVRPADLEVNFQAGELSIRAPRTSNLPAVELVSGERSVFEYVRSFRVPGGIASEKISAELNNGTLRLHLPKEDAMKPRQIPVTAS